MKVCRFCAEEIQDAAVKCKHCDSWLDGRDSGGAGLRPQVMRPAHPPLPPPPQVIVQQPGRAQPGAFASGFSGCLGVVFAVVFLIVMLGVCGAMASG
jgi:hypothetical protein